MNIIQGQPFKILEGKSVHYIPPNMVLKICH